MLIQKLSLLILLLQQLVVQLSQQNVQSTIFSEKQKPSVAKPVLLPVAKPEMPMITKIEPNKGGAGTVVTISGFGFDRDHNVVYTGVGEIVVSSPDGKTLSFTLPQPPFLSDKWLSNTADYRRQYYPEINFPLGFYVKNQNGVTAEPGLFSLTI